VAARPEAAYARAVVSGKEPACKWVRLACQRHLRDLRTGKERGLWFDKQEADRALQFLSNLRLFKGEWAGQRLELQPWQQFIVGSIFGWKGPDGYRRFRTAYNEVPRKNGKTHLAAAVGLKLFAFDAEPGAEVYSAATKKDQAKLAHRVATLMVRQSAALRKRARTYRDNLHSLETESKFEPLGADADTLDGLDPHGLIIDELHAHKTREVWDVLEGGTSARRQPLIFAITTAGYRRESICREVHDYVEKVLEGVIEDDTFFGYIATIDEGDEWENEDTWRKANPNLGASLKIEDLRRKVAKATEMPAALNSFLRQHLDIWTEQETRWITTESWDACGAPVDPEALFGRRCYAGLDLASTTDVAALQLFFPPEGEEKQKQTLSHFWVPDEGVLQRVRRDRVPYDAWIRDGHITATEGDVIDYDRIRADINELGERYEIVEIGADRWNATQIITQLGSDGFTVVPFGQGFRDLSAPSKELEKLILGRELAHGGNPVLRWMASNVAVKQDPAGNIKPDKSKSSEKIDGIVALVMAIGRAMVQTESGPSVYEDRGVVMV
jgi:phage terminase large subunit-like protein